MLADQIYLLLEKPWVGSLLGLAGLLGLPLAVYLYFLAKRSAALSYQLREFSVVGGRTAEFPEELEIRFAGEQVDQVTATEIVLWNSGNTTIDGSQIVLMDPLRVQVSSGVILKPTIIRQTRPVIGAVVSMGEAANVGNIGFDFLDPNDGFVVQFVHSGARGEMEIIGTVKELPKGLSKVRSPRAALFTARSVGLPRSTVLYVIMAVGVVAILASFLVPQLIERLYEPLVVRGTGRSLLVPGVLYVFMPGWMLWISRRRYPAALVDRQCGEDTPRPSHAFFSRRPLFDGDD